MTECCSSSVQMKFKDESMRFDSSFSMRVSKKNRISFFGIWENGVLKSRVSFLFFGAFRFCDYSQFISCELLSKICIFDIENNTICVVS